MKAYIEFFQEPHQEDFNFLFKVLLKNSEILIYNSFFSKFTINEKEMSKKSLLEKLNLNDFEEFEDLTMIEIKEKYKPLAIGDHYLVDEFNKL